MRARAIAVIILASASATASAQSDTVARGVELYAQADFEGAITALERALTEEGLTRDEAVLALDRLAAARLAVGDEEGVERTLAHLALLEPEHSFGPDVPAELVARLTSVRAQVGAIEVRLAEAPHAYGVELRASVVGDRWEAIRSVEIVCRSGATAGARGPRVTVAADDECEASAHGPGGVDLARTSWRGETRPAGGGVDPLALGLGIGGAVAVLVAVVVGVVVATSGGASQIEVRGPIVVGW